MSFRLFGVNVEIQMSFWITSVILGLRGLSDPAVPRGAIAIWVLVVFVSVLVHELGHALAVMRHGIEPQITLYAMGGLTRFQPLHDGAPLRRRDQVLISLAGPFAGFALGAIVLAVMHLFPHAFAGASTLRRYAVDSLLWVNFGWGLVNLMPVLPFDGGHVLEHALGPKRTQLTAAISTIIGFLVAALFVYLKAVWGALLFGLSAIQSYRRFTAPAAAEEAPASSEPTPPELAALLRAARHALGEEELERASTLAQRVIEGDDGKFAVPPAARLEALEVIAWAHLLAGRAEVAAEVLAQAHRSGTPDAALEGAVLFAREDFAGARKVLEAARAEGDTRKQIIGPLVQILIAQNEVGRAAEIALAVVDSLSDDDTRRMAGLAGEHGAFAPAARLHEAIFNRHHLAEDAYEAARAEAQAGRPERALDLLRRAVEAGFSDRARAWSDAALATLQAGPVNTGGTPVPPALEAVLPRSTRGAPPSPRP
jgi:Zn-dependent protease